MKLVQRSTIKLLVLLVLSRLIFSSSPLMAADIDYPTKPVTLICPFGPGGSNSVSAHIVLESLHRYSLKPQTFIISHRTGASGMIAHDYLVKQPADGYTLLWMDTNATTNLAKDPPKYPFTLKDFTFIGTFGYFPYVLAVSNERPFKTFEDFVDYAKKHPGELTASTPGIAGGAHLTVERLNKQAGIKITHVPFADGATGANAMLGGHVTSYVGSFGTFSSHVKAGRARVLVVFAEERFAPVPDVPTAKEKGYDVVLGGTRSSYPRAGCSRPASHYKPPGSQEWCYPLTY